MGKIGKDFCPNFLQPINVDAAGGLRGVIGDGSSDDASGKRDGWWWRHLL